jgi:hypothetical protein
MNQAMLARMLSQGVRVWPLPRRVRTDGLVLPTYRPHRRKTH